MAKNTSGLHCKTLQRLSSFLRPLFTGHPPAAASHASLEPQESQRNFFFNRALLCIFYPFETLKSGRLKADESPSLDQWNVWQKKACTRFEASQRDYCVREPIHVKTWVKSEKDPLFFFSGSADRTRNELDTFASKKKVSFSLEPLNSYSLVHLWREFHSVCVHY